MVRRSWHCSKHWPGLALDNNCGGTVPTTGTYNVNTGIVISHERPKFSWKIYNAFFVDDDDAEVESQICHVKLMNDSVCQILGGL